MKLFPALALLTWLCASLRLEAAALSGSSRPNIIYILADDLGYGDVHCLNPERGKIPTPCLDQFVTQGMSFTESHSGASVCTPTRYGVLTGRYAWRSHLQNGVLSNYAEPLIAPNRLTVPAFLKEAGYHTACIGKWHLGFTVEGEESGKKKGQTKDDRVAERRQLDRAGAPLGSVTHDGPITRGFDLYYGFHHARMIKSIFENETVTQILEPIDLLPALVKRSTAYIAERAQTGEPFFLYFAMNSPHTPISPSKEWQGRSGLGSYGDFVMETDWAVGEVLNAIEHAGVTENSLVIFTSDNGCSAAARPDLLEQKGHFPSADRRGYKTTIWDGGHHVPFMVRWPGKVPPGTRSDQLICHTDLLATCAEIVGRPLPPSAGEDSVSMLPALLGQSTAPLHEAVVHHSITGKFAIRQGPWKLELCPGSGGSGQPEDSAAEKEGLPDTQLYNVGGDIGETKNLQAEHPEVVARLTALLESYVKNGRSTPGPPQKNDVEVRLRKANTRLPAE